jgi:hypothetical protein
MKVSQQAADLYSSSSNIMALVVYSEFAIALIPENINNR